MNFNLSYRREDGIPLGKSLNETSVILQSYVENKDYFQIILGTVWLIIRKIILLCFSVESETRWTKINELTSEKKFRFETDDLVRYDNNEIFYIGRKTLTLKRFGIMINLEYIEQVKFSKMNWKCFWYLI